ncbi:MAG TPA: YihY/virulence factor BrkB family protein [Candidatus Xenobia bacterium]
MLAAWQAFGRDDCLLMAAGVAYYAFLSLFPLCLLSISLLGFLWTEPRAVDYTVNVAAELLPPSGTAWLRETVAGIAADRGRLGLLGLVSLIWLGRQLFQALDTTLNRLWKVDQPAVGRILNSLGWVAIAGALILIEGILSAVLTWMLHLVDGVRIPPWLPHPAVDTVLVWTLLHSWGVVPLTVFLFCFMLYRRPPRQAPVGLAAFGAGFSTAAWKISSVIYFTYLATLAQSNPVYGSLWGMVGLLIWLFICAGVFLFGAELIVVQV